MFVNKSRNPKASEILSQLFLNKELKSRVLTTLGLLLLVRLGIYIPMPSIDRVAFKSFIDQGGQLIGCLLYTSPSPRDNRVSRMPSSA